MFMNTKKRIKKLIDSHIEIQANKFNDLVYNQEQAINSIKKLNPSSLSGIIN